MALGATLLMGQTDYARQDALIFKANYYQPLDTLTMARYWRATALRSESIYNGNGSWGLGYADWPSQSTAVARRDRLQLHLGEVSGAMGDGGHVGGGGRIVPS